MSNLQLIEALCSCMENLLELVLRLASALDQIQGMDAENRAAVEAARERVKSIIGADEAPDFEEAARAASGLLEED